MGFLDSFYIGGFFVVAFGLAWMVGSLLERISGLSWLGRLPTLLVFVGVLTALPAVLRVVGEHTQARVTGREETLKVTYRGGDWSHAWRLGVAYAPRNVDRADPTARSASGDSVRLILAADREQYDRTKVGDLVDVVYLPVRPSIAKLDEFTLMDLARGFGQGKYGRITVVVLIVLVTGVAVFSHRPTARTSHPLRRVLGTVWAVAAVAAFVWTLARPFGPDDTSALDRTARARVTGTERITRSFWSSSRSRSRASDGKLTMPYDVVRLEYLNPSTGLPVLAAADVDTTSARLWARDSTVPIRYASSDLRRVRIDGATRDFVTANGRGAITEAVVVIGFFGLLIAFGVWRSARKRRRRSMGRVPLPG